MSEALSGPTVEPDTRRTSAVLLDILERFEDDRISIADFIGALGDRAYGLLLFAFALPNVAPIVPPGLSAVLGLPIIFVSWQLTYGRRIPWLPGILAERSFAREDLARGLDRVLPRLESVERFLRPRWQWLVGWNGERLIGFTCLILCIVLALPIPLGNILPALAISILGIAIVEKDGVVATIGYVAAVVSLVVVAAMLIALVQAFLFFLSHALS
jgi:hypothetical protein